MNSVPPKINSNGARLATTILAGTMVLASIAVFFFNPAKSRFYPVCEFHRLTGLNCPGCGMTRAFHALLHGDILSALRDNVLVIGLFFIAGLRAGWFTFNQFRGRRNGEFFPAKLLWSLLVLALLFAVLRNLPAFAFLSPIAG
jgi:hypothetical protein